MNFGWVTSGSAWVGLLTLCVLQVVLGVDNIVLLTVLTSRLKGRERERVQRLGVLVATISRLILLGLIAVLARVDKPFAKIGDTPVSVKAIILGIGGLFLIWKATEEMYHDVERVGKAKKATAPPSVGSILVHVFILDVVFSLDQVLTAVGMSPDVVIQVTSVLVAVVAMLFFVKQLAKFLEHHPSVRVLALSFLVMIGVSLCAEATGFNIPKGYLYFGLAYAVGIEWLNIRRRSNAAAAKVDESANPS
jgi:predicted tellurium resistance membrane protein TerC